MFWVSLTCLETGIAGDLVDVEGIDGHDRSAIGSLLEHIDPVLGVVDDDDIELAVAVDIAKQEILDPGIELVDLRRQKAVVVLQRDLRAAGRLSSASSVVGAAA